MTFIEIKKKTMLFFGEKYKFTLISSVKLESICRIGLRTFGHWILDYFYITSDETPSSYRYKNWDPGKNHDFSEVPVHQGEE